MAQKTLNIPEFKFQIGDNIRKTGSIDIYNIYNIAYSMIDNKWMYKYAYWEGGYEHHCKCSQEYVEANFEVVK